MTIFHAIKFSDVDIDNDDQLKTLPVEVVSTWRNRLTDYAVDQALTCVHLDVTGTAQGCIDAIADYRAGKITKEELVKIADSYPAHYSYSTYSAAYSADAAAASSSSTYSAAYSAYYARKSLGMSPTWNQVKAEHKVLLTKWLVEELLNFEIEVTV